MLAVRATSRTGPSIPSFGVNIVRLTPATESFANSIALSPTGGSPGRRHELATGPSSISVVRLQPNGSLDGAFGTEVTTIDASGNGTEGTMFDLALQADGRIVSDRFRPPRSTSPRGHAAQYGTFRSRPSRQPLVPAESSGPTRGPPG